MKTKKGKAVSERKPLGLYVHIPFCVKKCAYCSFLSFPAGESEREAYTDTLCKEIRAYEEISDDYLVESIYFGGGTPSILKIDQLSRILDAIKSTFLIRGINEPEETEKKKKKNKKEKESFLPVPETPEERVDRVRNKTLAEVTIEVNPKTVTGETLRELYELSFNRLSIGLQSANQEELSMLSRIHTAAEFEETFHAAREAGFRNISVDLMAGLPEQTEEKLKKSLSFVERLNPEHISVYDLQIEEGTEFFDRFGENGPEKQKLPDEELDRTLYHQTESELLKNGYLRYEISNYAKLGFESRHNSSYWIGTEYLGFGLGASSLLTNARFHNSENLQKYMEADGEIYEIREDIERLTEKERIEEFMFLGLRMCRGVEKEEFRRRFQKELETVYGDVLKKLFSLQVLAEADGRIFLTKRGLDVSNTVFVEFIKDE